MKKVFINLEKFYFILLVLLVIIIIITNSLIRDNLYISKDIIIGEEAVESVMISVLFLIGYFIFKQYKKILIEKDAIIKDEEQKKKNLNQQLEDNFKYIGKVNVQLQEIKKIMSGFNKYPESKNDFKNISNYVMHQALGVISADWIELRLLDLKNEKILHKKISVRGEKKEPKIQINTKELIINKKFKQYIILSSRQENLNLKAYIILPSKEYSDDDYTLARAVMQQLEMLYIIYSSQYYLK